jgi:hypothetical protein
MACSRGHDDRTLRLSKRVRFEGVSMFDDSRGYSTIVFGSISKIESLRDHGGVEVFVITQLLDLMSSDDGEKIVLDEKGEGRERERPGERGREVSQKMKKRARERPSPRIYERPDSHRNKSSHESGLVSIQLQ